VGVSYGGTVSHAQFAADAEKEDNVAEQKRQHGKRVRYGEVVQVRLTDTRAEPCTDSVSLDHLSTS